MEDLHLAIPDSHPGFSHPFPLQSATAFTNFSIAVHVLFKNPRETNAMLLTEMVSALLFQKIKAHRGEYRVSDILKLPEEQEIWRTKSAEDPCTTDCSLSAVLVPIWRQRLALYHADVMRGAEMVIRNSGRTAGYGIVGFLAKRWLSQISGRPILHEESLAEAGFDDLGLSAFYFNRVSVAIGEEFSR